MTTDSSTGDWTPERGAALLRDVEEREQISPDDGPARWAPGDAPRRCVIVESTDVRAALREIERLTLARDIAETAEHRLTEERDEARGMLKNAYNDRDAMAAEIERLRAELAALRARPTLTEERSDRWARKVEMALCGSQEQSDDARSFNVQLIAAVLRRAAAGEWGAANGEPLELSTRKPVPGSGVLVPHPANVLATRAALEAALHDPDTAEGAAALLADLEAP